MQSSVIFLILGFLLYGLSYADVFDQLPSDGIENSEESQLDNESNTINKSCHDPIACLSGEAVKTEESQKSESDSPYYEENKGKNEIVGAPLDQYGNADCLECELTKNDGFKDCKIAVLHLYTGEGFNFELPKKALEEKGFIIHRWADNPPNPLELEKVLKESSQLWIISDKNQKLYDEHLKIVKTFFDTGKGLYIWGDNYPYYVDANNVARALFGTGMEGFILGDKIVGLQSKTDQRGLVPNHLISTGLRYIYEGVTIATIQYNSDLNPLIYGSALNVVAATYEKDGKRAILDGGYTRLFAKWDSAGTGKYVKNAAGWLVNYERFGMDNCRNQAKY